MAAMRVRTDEKRNEILEAATAVFREVGYERASMAMIAERVGGSKTTLYGYYPSKEELFWDAMVGAIKVERGEKAMALLDANDPDVRGVLERFGTAYSPLFTMRDTMAVTRTAIAEALTNRDLSSLLYQRGPKRILDALTAYFSQLKKKGFIRNVDPRLAAIHLKGLFDSGIVEPLLFGCRAELKNAESIPAAVDVFLRAYCA
jgi:AcrR family transcriptional regulator